MEEATTEGVQPQEDVAKILEPQTDKETQEELDLIHEAVGTGKGTVIPPKDIDDFAPSEVIEPEPEPEQEPEQEPESQEEPVTEEPTSQPVTSQAEPEKDDTGVYDQPTAVDPGDFKPRDYSFTVQTTDGKTRTFKTLEDVESFETQIDGDSALISPGQFSLFNRKSSLMEKGVADDRYRYDQSKEAWEAERAQQEARDQYNLQWYNEANYLRKTGKLPSMSDELSTADWRDPEVAKQPAVKETIAIYDWMEKENNQRMAAGLPPEFSLVSAYNAMQLDAIKNGERDEENRAKTASRKQGARVSGKTPYVPTNDTRKGMIVGPQRGLDALMADYAASQEY